MKRMIYSVKRASTNFLLIEAELLCPATLAPITELTLVGFSQNDLHRKMLLRLASIDGEDLRKGA